MKKILEIKHISKSFPGVKALNDVSLDVYAGEVVALVGENGAGKSTLIKILAGVYAKDSGETLFEGKAVEIQNTKMAQELGISVIFQELNLLPNLSVAENLFVGREKRKNTFFYDKKETFAQAKELMGKIGLVCDPSTLIGDLPVSQQQMVEIAKAQSIDTKLIIMDEPTSSLTEKEIETLFTIIEQLKANGVAVIFVSHKLGEIKRIADRVHVLRDGEYVGVINKDDVCEANIIQMMVGRDIGNTYFRTETKIGSEVLRVSNLTNVGFVKDVSFTLHKGEILGFAGLMGAGRTETMYTIFGITPSVSGEIFIEGERVIIRSPKDAIKLGICLVPEDRKTKGLVLGMSVAQNLSIVAIKKISANGFLCSDKENELANHFIQQLQIKTPSSDQEVVNLSGGNQQKVVLGKWMSSMPKVLIVDEPTRGIDVRAKKEVYTLINDLAKRGVGIILISSELSEVIGMSDRIIVMHEGAVKGEIKRDEASQSRIMATALKE